MKLRRRQFLHLAAGTVALPVVSRAARAQTYPTRPVRFIVPLAVGGGLDLVARLIGEYLSRTFGQQVIIENKVGAGGMLGIDGLRLHGYYGGVRLPTVVHHRLRLLAFPMRTTAARVMSAAGRPWDLPVPVQEASARARVCDHAGSSGRLQKARPCVWPSTFGTVSAPGMIGLSRFNGWPVHSPADASPAPLRTFAHGSGPMWVATPSP